MDAFLSAAVILLPLVYLLAAVEYGMLFFNSHPFALRSARPTLTAAVLLHLAALIVLGARWGQFPAASVSQALSMLAFAVAALYLFLEWRSDERASGFWLVSLVFFFQLAASLTSGDAPPERELFRSPFFATHVSLGLLGYTGFAVAAVYGFLYLRLYKELQNSRFSTFYGKLPPLAVLEKMMVGSLSTGFVALTGAVISGAVWAEGVFGESWLTDPKSLVTVGVWALCGLALGLRWRRHWGGRQTARASLICLAIVLASLLALSLIGNSFHVFR